MSIVLSRILFLVCLALLVPGQSIADPSIRIVSQNMNRFFDNIDDGNNEKVLSDQAFNKKLRLSTDRIVNLFDLPDVIALQEVENRNVLDHLVKTLVAKAGVHYRPLILEGNDVSGIDVAFLVQTDFEIKLVKQLYQDARLKLDGNELFSRPPLYIQICKPDYCLNLVNLHLRSMRGIRSNSKGDRVRSKRLAQATAIAGWVEDFQQSNPRERLMLLGDFNALTPSDVYVDVAGIIRGNPDNSSIKLKGEDLISDDLVDITRLVPLRKRYSFIYKGNKQILDYMFISSNFKPALTGVEFTWIDYKFSDHAGLVADFTF